MVNPDMVDFDMILEQDIAIYIYISISDCDQLYISDYTVKHGSKISILLNS